MIHKNKFKNPIQLGRKRNYMMNVKEIKAKKGESFYFTPDSTHYITASGSKEACILWVSSPPSF